MCVCNAIEFNRITCCNLTENVMTVTMDESFGQANELESLPASTALEKYNERACEVTMSQSLGTCRGHTVLR